jgi:hypothetical protein
LFAAARLRPLIDGCFASLHRPVRQHLALLVEAFVTLTAALRSGHGALPRAAVARAVPGLTSVKDRDKRLNRFLDNKRFDPPGLTEGLFGVLLGLAATPTVAPILLD